jgi:hypothetical protein
MKSNAQPAQHQPVSASDAPGWVPIERNVAILKDLKRVAKYWNGAIAELQEAHLEDSARAVSDCLVEVEDIIAKHETHLTK